MHLECVFPNFKLRQLHLEPVLQHLAALGVHSLHLELFLEEGLALALVHRLMEQPSAWVESASVESASVAWSASAPQVESASTVPLQLVFRRLNS